MHWAVLTCIPLLLLGDQDPLKTLPGGHLLQASDHISRQGGQISKHKKHKGQISKQGVGEGGWAHLGGEPLGGGTTGPYVNGGSQNLGKAPSDIALYHTPY